MSRTNLSRMILVAWLLPLTAGCFSQEQTSESAASSRPGAADLPLATADLERFLAVVHNHSAALIPEFALPEDESLDMDASAADLVASFRGQVQRLFDARRQGAIWESDEQWSQALASQKLSAERFATLVRKVSLSIMRVRLEARVDIDEVVVQARQQVDENVRLLDEIDAVPRRKRTREFKVRRMETAERLGKAVALLEFAEMVRTVHSDNASLVRKYSRKLKPLIPPHANDELLAELKALATPRDDKALHAGYEIPEQDDER